MFTRLQYLFPNFSTVVEIKQLYILLRRVRLSHNGPAFLLDAPPPIIMQCTLVMSEKKILSQTFFEILLLLGVSGIQCKVQFAYLPNARVLHLRNLAVPMVSTVMHICENAYLTLCFIHNTQSSFQRGNQWKLKFRTIDFNLLLKVNLLCSSPAPQLVLLFLYPIVVSNVSKLLNVIHISQKTLYIQ